MAGLFGQKGQNTTEPRLNAIQIAQSTYGAVVPLVYGKHRVPGGLIWYNNFQAIPHTTRTGGKGGGGSTNTSYTYKAALILMLAEGPILGVGNVWSDKDITTLSNLGLSLVLGGDGDGIWPYLTGSYGAQAIPYRHTAYVNNSSFDLGSSAAIPNLNFEVKGFLPYLEGTIDDCEPAAVLADYCSNLLHGCGFPYLDPNIQGPGVTNYQAYCRALSLFLAPRELTQRPASEFIEEILRVTNSAAVWSGEVLKVIPYGDESISGNSRTYTPDLTPLFSFTDDDYVVDGDEDPVRPVLKPADQIFNILRIEYPDRANAYNVVTAEWKDDNDIALNGERTKSSERFDCIVTADVARRVVQLMGQRQLYYPIQYEFSVRSDYCLLEPMDIVSINDSALNLSNVLCRVLSVEDNENDELTLLVERMPVGPGNAPVYNWQLSQGYAANFNFAPGNVNTPVMFMAPQALIDSPNSAELWVALSGGSAWGGAYIWMSLDGTNYRVVGGVTGPARHGTLRSLLPSVADPDTSSTLQLQLANTALAIGAGSTADADNLRTLIFVDGEIMSYRDATLVGTGQYDLAYLRRGKYGSAAVSHANGSAWARIDSALARIPIDPGMIGQTVHLKFQSFNTVGRGLEDIATLPAYTKALPVAPINSDHGYLQGRGVQVVGDTVYKPANGSDLEDADCFSLRGFEGGCHLQFRPGNLLGAWAAGINSDPSTDQTSTSIDYAWYAVSTTLQIRESGSFIALYGTYTTSTFLEIVCDGAYVYYKKDGVTVRTVAAPLKRFFFDSTFSAPKAQLNGIAFFPLNEKDVGGGANLVFLDTFEHQNWQARYNNRSGTSATVTYPANGSLGGKVLSAAGGEFWIASAANIPFDPNALYRITARVRRRTGTVNANCYVGVEGVAADGVTLINESGSNSASGQHYNCLRGYDLGAVTVDQWVDAVGYFNGNAASGFGVSVNNVAPTPLYTGVKYFRPLVILNYAAGTGTQEVDYIKVERLIVPDDADNSDQSRLIPDAEVARSTTKGAFWDWTPSGSVSIQPAAGVIGNVLEVTYGQPQITLWIKRYPKLKPIVTGSQVKVRVRARRTTALTLAAPAGNSAPAVYPGLTTVVNADNTSSVVLPSETLVLTDPQLWALNEWQEFSQTFTLLNHPKNQSQAPYFFLFLQMGLNGDTGTIQFDTVDAWLV